MSQPAVVLGNIRIELIFIVKSCTRRFRNARNRRRARRALLGRSLWAYPLIFAISLGIITQKCPAGAAALFLMGLIEFGLGAMTDALEVTRHLFLFNTIWDVTLFGAVCALAVMGGGRPRPSQAGILDPAELVVAE